MRDLKHLLYFENLLQEANNELIAQAKAEGKVCVAYTCENVPEPLLNLPGCFSIRLHAPHTGSMDIATYYMTNLLCEPSRALLERAIEGGFNFSDCVITPDGCTMMNRCVENMELLHTMGEGNPKFFHEYMEIAFKNTESDVALSSAELAEKSDEEVKALMPNLRVVARALPTDKSRLVRLAQELDMVVGMTGDGVNDSPALSEADAGIAISTGAAIAKEIADITISAQDLFCLVTLRKVSEGMMKRIGSNYCRIIGFNAALMLLGASGIITPAMSALLHNSSTVAISLASMKNYLEDNAQ